MEGKKARGYDESVKQGEGVITHKKGARHVGRSAEGMGGGGFVGASRGDVRANR